MKLDKSKIQIDSESDCKLYKHDEVLTIYWRFFIPINPLDIEHFSIRFDTKDKRIDMYAKNEKYLFECIDNFLEIYEKNNKDFEAVANKIMETKEQELAKYLENYANSDEYKIIQELDRNIKRQMVQVLGAISPNFDLVIESVRDYDIKSVHTLLENIQKLQIDIQAYILGLQIIQRLDNDK